ncbi:hypothetical protein GC087_07160 [Pantoea sp. JZ2]|uniref:hypothetical protein n=1 Tax=Pantoea sp. JZ2 TaxID=2654189 RepID=UPI002B4867A7|nr:hypothetical protein [Pantoea sp. JZ2]WRH12413.1 hypothetical protein GC087_07160 [Pantoea sp. JZ2]
MKITEREMRGLLTGKCLPGDMRINEDLPAYLVRKFDELQQKLDALAAENTYLKDSVAMHAAGFSECSVCGNEESCETHDIVWMAKETPATDAYMNSVRMEGRYEGINYAAGRLAAAFNHGFVDKPKREVFDVVRMILSAKEDLSDDPQIARDGLSGEYAEKSLKEWEEELRSGTHDTAEKAG